MDRYQCLKLVYSDRLSRFFTKLPKNNIGVSWGVFDTPHDAPNAPMMGAITGASDIPHDAPMLFFDNLVKFFLLNCQKITWGHLMSPHNGGCHGDPQHHLLTTPSTPPPPTPLMTHPTTTHPKNPSTTHHGEKVRP